MRPIILAVCFVLITTTEAVPWGASGHSIIGELAARRLKPAASEKLKEILGGEVSLASLGSWADDFKNTLTGNKTKPWHYVDIDVNKAGYSEASDCPTKILFAEGAQRADCDIVERSAVAVDSTDRLATRPASRRRSDPAIPLH